MRKSVTINFDISLKFFTSKRAQWLGGPQRPIKKVRLVSVLFYSVPTEPFVFRTKKNSNEIFSAGPRIVSALRRWGFDVKFSKMT